MPVKTIDELTIAPEVIATDLGVLRKGSEDHKVTQEMLAEYFLQQSAFGFVSVAIAVNTVISTITEQEILYKMNTSVGAKTLTLPFAGGGIQAGARILVTNFTGSDTATVTYQAGVSLIIPAGGYAEFFFDGTALRLKDNSVLLRASDNLQLGGAAGVKLIGDATKFTARNAGNTLDADIQAKQIKSTVATGTAPFEVASETQVTNLKSSDSDKVDGYHAAEIATPSTAAIRDASGDITARVLKSNVAIGTPPLTVTSTTKVTNLNAEQLDGADLSIDGTLASNSDVLIPSEQAVKTYVDTSKMVFDLVIDSDAKFLAWQTSGTWKKVLIKAGTWTLPIGGINLTDRGTTCVVGESGSTLVFSEVANGVALYKAALPTTVGHFMSGVAIDCTASSAVGIGFQNIANMDRCAATLNITGAVGNSYAARGCNNLVNCIMIINTTGSSNNQAQGYSECNNLVNCTGTASAVGTGGVSGYAYGFWSCNNLTNCTGNGTGNSTTATFSGGSGHGIGISNNLTNCTGNGTAVQGSSYAVGIYGCNAISHCTGNGTVLAGSGQGQGFSQCVEVIACKGKGLSAGSGTGYGFVGCRHCGYNRANGASKTGVFNSSYCDNGNSVTVAADTAASAWNLITNS